MTAGWGLSPLGAPHPTLYATDARTSASAASNESTERVTRHAASDRVGLGQRPVGLTGRDTPAGPVWSLFVVDEPERVELRLLLSGPPWIEGDVWSSPPRRRAVRPLTR